MEIEVVLPVPLPSSPEFSFDSATSTPYITAPSSPQRFGTYAPSSFYSPSPSTAASAVDLSRTSFSINPALWEEDNPGISGKNLKTSPDFIELEDFEFEFDGSNSSRFESSPALADELFDHGKIKPLKMMVNPQSDQTNNTEPPIPCSAAFTAPKRVCDILTEDDEGEENDEERMNQNQNPPTASSAQTSGSRTFSNLLSSIAIPKNYRKWSFRDFLLFRSASEGRGTSIDPLRKFPALGGKIGRSESFGESTRGSTSFRAAAAAGEESSGRRQQRSRAPHEAYYSANKAAAEEMKRRTMLPYKQGLLGGCLGFNPNPGAHHHDLGRSFGSLHSRDHH